MLVQAKSNRALVMLAGTLWDSTSARKAAVSTGGGEIPFFGGQLDVQRTILNLYRRMFPTNVIRSKAQEYTAQV